MRVAVVGLGKIGLPLAVQIARGGAEIIGVDIDEGVVRSVNTGSPQFPGEDGLEQAIASVVNAGRLVGSLDCAGAVESSDVVLVIVPVGLHDGRPDLRSLEDVAREVAKGLRADHLVILESTVPVGTTRWFGARLGSLSGLEPGREFSLAFSPERVSSGTVFHDLSAYPKLVGGIDRLSTERAVRFYRSVLTFNHREDLERANGVWAMGSADEAELTKLAETTYRDVNIALANEFARHAEEIGADYRRVKEAANSQPYSHLHSPGLVGGHCIPVYPHLYMATDRNARIPRVAREVNASQAVRIVDTLATLLGGLEDAIVAILGVTYRGGVKEVANSGGLELVAEIERRRGVAQVHDSLLDGDDFLRLGLSPFALGDRCDAVVVQAAHPEYSDLMPWQVPGCSVAIDILGVLPEYSWGSATVWRMGRGLSGTQEASGSL